VGGGAVEGVWVVRGRGCGGLRASGGVAGVEILGGFVFTSHFVCVRMKKKE